MSCRRTGELQVAASHCTATSKLRIELRTSSLLPCLPLVLSLSLCPLSSSFCSSSTSLLAGPCSNLAIHLSLRCTCCLLSEDGDHRSFGFRRARVHLRREASGSSALSRCRLRSTQPGLDIVTDPAAVPGPPEGKILGTNSSSRQRLGYAYSRCCLRSLGSALSVVRGRIPSSCVDHCAARS